jgi:hypothetical protein
MREQREKSGHKNEKQIPHPRFAESATGFGMTHQE